jgi:hypothetical protein
MTEPNKVNLLDNKAVGCLVREEILKQDPDAQDAVVDSVTDIVVERLNKISIDTVLYWIKPKGVKSMGVWSDIQNAHRENKFVIRTKL